VKHIWFWIAWCALLLSPSGAAIAQTSHIPWQPGGQVHVGGLLNPEQFSMTHSYAFSYSSAGGRSEARSLYVNSLRYALSSDLTLELDLGYLSRGTPLATQRGTILPRFRLSYRPDPRLLLEIDYGSAPGPNRFLYPEPVPWSSSSEWRQ
jgi:hypothetical protein